MSWAMKACAFLPAKWIPLWQRFLPATALVSLVPWPQLGIKGKIRVVDYCGLVGFHPCSFGTYNYVVAYVVAPWEAIGLIM